MNGLECLSPYPLRVTGDDERADMVVALLCVGLYPNVCFHKEKRQLLISEGKRALIHKTSVNNITKDPKFMSPYFVFGEKVLTDGTVVYLMVCCQCFFKKRILGINYVFGWLVEDKGRVSKVYDNGGAYSLAAVWIQLCGIPWQQHCETG